MQWVANNGLAVAIVVAGGIAIWRVSGWLALNVITPLKDAFITHLNSIGTFMKATTESLELTARSMDTISEQLKGIRKDIDTMSRKDDAEVQ